MCTEIVSRICTTCGVEKSIADFSPKDRSGRRSQVCKPCVAIYMREYVRTHPDYREYRNRYAKAYAEKYPDRKRRVKLGRFGLTLEGYTELLKAQGDVCAICRGPETNVDKRTGNLRALAVDHDHATGTVRGLLCADCNRALGLLRENPDTLQRMIDYLEKSGGPFLLASNAR